MLGPGEAMAVFIKKNKQAYARPYRRMVGYAPGDMPIFFEIHNLEKLQKW